MPRLALVTTEEPTPKTTVTVSPRLQRLTTARIEKRAQIDLLTKDVKELDEQLLKEAKQQGGKIDTDAWIVTACKGKSVHVKKETLLALGVRASIIKKATSETPYEYVKVTVKGAARA